MQCRTTFGHSQKREVSVLTARSPNPGLSASEPIKTGKKSSVVCNI